MYELGIYKYIRIYSLQEGEVSIEGKCFGKLEDSASRPLPFGGLVRLASCMLYVPSTAPD